MSIFKSASSKRTYVKFPRKRSRIVEGFWGLIFFFSIILLIFFAYKIFFKDESEINKGQNHIQKAEEKPADTNKTSSLIKLSPEIRSSKTNEAAHASPMEREINTSFADDPRINLAGITDPNYQTGAVESDTLEAARADEKNQARELSLQASQIEEVTQSKPQAASTATDSGQNYNQANQAALAQSESGMNKKNPNAAKDVRNSKENTFDNPWGVPFVGYGLKEAAALIESRHSKIQPGNWINQHPDIYNKTPLKPASIKGPAIALTVNLHGPDTLDPGLLTFLQNNNIPTSFFVSSQWIARNKQDFAALTSTTLFLIEGHGKKSVPCSVSGLELQGIKGSSSILELLQEVEGNMRDIQRLASHRPQWFRSIFAQYENIAADIISKDLNISMAGFSIYAYGTAEEMAEQILKAQDKDIILVQSSGDGRLLKALETVVPTLKAKGFTLIPLISPKE